MIPKLFRSGKSFKKLAAYLMHDAGKAQTSDRVQWIAFRNLASDTVSGAVDEMLWTYRGAEWLKKQAAVRAGGRPLENPVRHFSLNWHPSEKPSQAQMLSAVEEFFQHMGWSEHQAVIFHHNDKKHAHVHVMLNAVSPETGLALNAGFEWRRAQQWAEIYERENGLIFCEERLKPVEEREKSPTRAAWEEMKKSEFAHERAEYERISKDFDYFTRNDPVAGKNAEWKLLKELQREEREAFFMGGKEAYRAVRNQVFREVRTEFKEYWRLYYEGMKKGHPLETMMTFKEAIIGAQKAELEARRKAASDELRKERDSEYKVLLAGQDKERVELRQRQKDGLSSHHLLDRRYRQEAKASQNDPERAARGENLSKSSRSEADKLTRRQKDTQIGGKREERQETVYRRAPGVKGKGPMTGAGDLGLGALAGLATIVERLFDGFLGGDVKSEEQQQPMARESAQESQQTRASEAASTKAAQEREASEAKALKDYWDQRQSRKRERD